MAARRVQNPGPVMNCHECEILILDSLDNPVTHPPHAELDAHLAGCPACRQFQEAQWELDADLTAALSRLSPGPQFKAQMLGRIALLPAPLSLAEIEAKKRQFDAEFSKAQARLQSEFKITHARQLIWLVAFGAVGLTSGMVVQVVFDRLKEVPWSVAGPAFSSALAALIVVAALGLDRTRRTARRAWRLVVP